MIRKLLFTTARSGHDLAHELGLASYAFHQASQTSKLEPRVHPSHLGKLLICRCGFHRSGRGLRVCNSSQLPGDAHATLGLLGPSAEQQDTESTPPLSTTPEKPPMPVLPQQPCFLFH